MRSSAKALGMTCFSRMALAQPVRAALRYAPAPVVRGSHMAWYLNEDFHAFQEGSIGRKESGTYAPSLEEFVEDLPVQIVKGLGKVKAGDGEGLSGGSPHLGLQGRAIPCCVRAPALEAGMEALVAPCVLPALQVRKASPRPEAVNGAGHHEEAEFKG
eukprot:15462405-Alexandrium_andersonii.AAC.1